jgi:hypothetical protein
MFVEYNIEAKKPISKNRHLFKEETKTKNSRRKKW